MSPCHLPFPKGGEGAGGHLGGGGGLRRRRFFASSQAPRICPSRSSALSCWAAFPPSSSPPAPPCLFPPTPSRTACSAFLKD